MPKSERHRRAHSLSSSEDESTKSHEDSENESTKSHKDSENEGSNSNRGPMKMPEMLDPEEYKDFQGQPLLTASDITEDDEVWVVQCPKNVDPNLLMHKKITFGGPSKVKLHLEDGKQQKLEICSEIVTQQFLTCILPSSGRLQAVPVPLQGRLLVTERMEVADEDQADFSHLLDKTGKVPLPQGLKLRHPLFGSEYAERISGPRYIKIKKRRKRERESEAETSMVNSEAPRRKKRKVSETQEETPEPTHKKQRKENSESEETPRKSKKIKEEIPSTPSSSKKTKTPKAIKQELQSDTELSPPKKKKKKKSKHNSDDDD